MAPRRVSRMIHEYCGTPKQMKMHAELVYKIRNMARDAETASDLEPALRLVDAMLTGNKKLQELRKVNFPKEKKDIENLKAQIQKKMDKVAAEAEVPEVPNQQEVEASIHYIEEDIENLKAQIQKKMDKVTAEAEVPEVPNQQETEAVPNQPETEAVSNQQETKAVPNQQETASSSKPAGD